MNRTIKAEIDEYGFPFLIVELINPDNGKHSGSLKAIIDTGAAGCLIQQAVADKLGLTCIGHSELLNPRLGIIPSNNYMITLGIDLFGLEGSAEIEGLPVGTLDDPNYPAAMIIGMSFLKNCNFEYKGKEKSFILTIEM